MSAKYEKARAMLDGMYMVARMSGEDVEPPSHWSVEQVAAFERVLASPEGRDALLAAALRGWQRLNTKASQLPD